MTKSFINLNNARSDDQRSTMKEIQKNEECPFCSENLDKYHKQPILKKGKYWVLSKNQWPYDHTDYHFIAITTEHTEKLADLSRDSFSELLSFVQWAEKEYRVEAGGLAMRFGDVKKNGASVVHLHVHFIVPTSSKPKGAKVKFKISD